MKQPFTQEGLNAHLEEIYGTSRAQRLRVIAALQQDFKKWIVDNFELSDSQLLFVSGLNNEFVNHAAALTALAFSNQTPIKLIKPEQPGLLAASTTAVTLAETDSVASSADAEGKLINLGYTADPADASIEVLTYEISYANA